MKPALLMLLGLMAIAPFAGAADWLSWQKVGDATLTWGPFTIYTSQLRTPEGRYRGLGEDQALIISYQHTIERQELVDATREQWRAQGILAREALSESWLRTLGNIWPDVVPGMQLAFVQKARRGQFWYRMSATQRHFIPLGPPQSAAFSENFLAIWLGPRTQYPELRQQLTGGDE
ncbi:MULTISPECIES: hypothetical protein [Serratia]|uniref:hypothetical protein n=1 Tax=Serratia TaxID=613 RepID=UPI00062CA432|nr:MULTISPECIES: hypothetical protein [Serratia]KKZ20006.1 periplasmic protein [Serratia marcescens]MBE4972143.1 hypothetical protein [Serratia sp. X3]MCH6192463.1 hypothetical protein [Serratia sp. X10]MDI3196566.1 hypothetical protein [Serratia ureilytica]UUW16794.1 hypothetical protein NAL25_16460 [Serratia ureilytica]